MPYFVFAVRPFAQLECLGEHASFAQASAMAKALRAQRAGGAGPASGAGAMSAVSAVSTVNAAAGAAEQIRVVFAADALAAEDLLLQPREPAPPGDE